MHRRRALELTVRNNRAVIHWPLRSPSRFARSFQYSIPIQRDKSGCALFWVAGRDGHFPRSTGFRVSPLHLIWIGYVIAVWDLSQRFRFSACSGWRHRTPRRLWNGTDRESTSQRLMSNECGRSVPDGENCWLVAAPMIGRRSLLWERTRTDRLRAKDGLIHNE